MWSAYREKYGPLNPVRMYDQGHAIVAWQINNSHQGKAKPIDFMPWSNKRQEQPDGLSAEEFIAALGKGAKIGR